jgi:NAD(P)-dependent dehydrogenase (short-subunit alcohol dehydrogenase family)
MTPERKVVVITGASRGIGAQLSKAYRHIGYQVIASSRSMRKSVDPAILVIEGDITRPETAERIMMIIMFGDLERRRHDGGEQR